MRMSSTLLTSINRNLATISSHTFAGPAPTILATSQACSSHISKYDSYLFDCDGVVYRVSEKIPGATESIQYLQSQNKRCLFVTNSSGRDRESMRAKLSKVLGMELETDQMVPSCFTAASYIQENHPNVKKALVLGDAGVVSELERVGVECIGGPDDHGKPAEWTESDIENYEIDPDVGAVVVGMCTNFTYAMVAKANLYLLNKDVVFVSTNQDPYDVLRNGRPQPAAGVMIRALEAVAERPATNVGKPSKYLGKMLQEKLGVDPTKALFVGDRLDTDIEFGINNNIDTALVLSGCSTGEVVKDLYAKAANGEDATLPTVIIPHLGLFNGDLSSDVEEQMSKL
ncbi:hypothetical protein TL16_g07406 [Triparma laevis f. inornata]|uniref:Uncharacterized protein n=2 Tax=Triparma laevis TaxID=1534972 RepID=A0A9W7AR18_9STRA|nr:hypothetical protein TrLO_g7014 [Triparma laevis f. longispina]GMH77437.1 hypothetical protein TL16_g07406 [Triparma laevis f. inornata]